MILSARHHTGAPSKVLQQFPGTVYSGALGMACGLTYEPTLLHSCSQSLRGEREVQYSRMAIKGGKLWVAGQGLGVLFDQGDWKKWGCYRMLLTLGSCTLCLAVILNL